MVTKVKILFTNEPDMDTIYFEPWKGVSHTPNLTIWWMCDQQIFMTEYLKLVVFYVILITCKAHFLCASIISLSIIGYLFFKHQCEGGTTINRWNGCLDLVHQNFIDLYCSLEICNQILKNKQKLELLRQKTSETFLIPLGTSHITPKQSSLPGDKNVPIFTQFPP